MKLLWWFIDCHVTIMKLLKRKRLEQKLNQSIDFSLTLTALTLHINKNNKIAMRRKLIKIIVQLTRWFLSFLQQLLLFLIVNFLESLLPIVCYVEFIIKSLVSSSLNYKLFFIDISYDFPDISTYHELWRFWNTVESETWWIFNLKFINFYVILVIYFNLN